MLQRSKITKLDYQVGDMLNFSNSFPFTGWVYVTKLEKLSSGYTTLVYVRSLTDPRRESIIDPSLTNRKIINGEVEYVPIKTT